MDKRGRVVGVAPERDERGHEVERAGGGERGHSQRDDGRLRGGHAREQQRVRIADHFRPSERRRALALAQIRQHHQRHHCCRQDLFHAQIGTFLHCFWSSSVFLSLSISLISFIQEKTREQPENFPPSFFHVIFLALGNFLSLFSLILNGC